MRRPLERDVLAYVARMERVLEDRVPPDWRFDPKDTTYIHGLGLDARRLRHVIGDIERAAGMEAFCLQDRPDLEQAIHQLLADGDNGVSTA